MANIIGTNRNDTLEGTYNYDTLTGGGGKDIFVYKRGDGTDTITDFGGIGKGTKPTAAVIAEVDTIKFVGEGLTARNLLLAQNGTNLEITFEGVADTKVMLQNFALENLDNLTKSTGATVDSGNILFDGQTSITDRFDVFDANSTQSTLFRKNTVTFLNDLSNNIIGFDNSDDVINGQGGNDIIQGGSGNDLLRGGVGNDTLIGSAGNNLLSGDDGNDSLTASGYGYSYFSDGGVVVTYDDFSLGNNTLNGGAGNDTLSARASKGNNLLDGGNGNDYLNISGYFDSQLYYDEDFPYYGTYDFRSSGNNLLSGGNGDDTLSASGSIGDNLLFGGDGNDYLDISGYITYYSYNNREIYESRSFGDNLLSGGNGNDTLSASGALGNNTLNGGAGDDSLSTEVSPGKNSPGNNLLSGGDGNDTLSASRTAGNNTLDGGYGNDILTGGYGNDILTGGGGKDKFVYNYPEIAGIQTITDFGGVGKGTNPTAEVIAEVDTLVFTGYNFTVRNLLLTQNGNNLEISFEGLDDDKIILQNFALENLNNLSTSTGASVDSGNILFNGETNITDSFDVFSANSTQSTVFRTNTVTFLNDLNNNVKGFDNSDDVINGQGGDDIINGLSGNDILRGGAGNNTLNGGTGADTLNIDYPTGNNLLNGGDGNDSLTPYGYGVSTYAYYRQGDDIFLGKNTLNGGAGADTLDASGSKGDNLLNGGDDDDVLSIGKIYYYSFGNNTLNGGAGDDQLNATYSKGDNLLDGGDGNDTLTAEESTGKNLLFGGNGNDYLDISGYVYSYYDDTRSRGNNLLDGGDGNDTLTAFNALGNNTLKGGNGDDILIGGNGNDRLYGGGGTDTFAFNSIYEGIDTIYDFNPTNELIQMSRSYYNIGGLSVGVLLANQFTIGASATTSAQRFIYNSTTGALFFDPDGSASGSNQRQFALLTAGLSLTNNNFVVA
ncbi:MAG: beta strand repeat-containing protein [Nostoc sp. EkiNYC01]|nr:calcium-binding protein [Nostoc sp. EkiNYC01]